MKFLYILFYLFIIKIGLIAGIQGSKHDLSMSNFYGTMGGATTHICIFCHTPHGANNGLTPLWNRKITDTTVFTLYDGTNALPNNPTLVCLSCHDGVSGMGDTSAVNASNTHGIINSAGPGHGNANVSPNCYACHFSGNTYPDKEWRIGPNLMDDHPVSVSYNAAKVFKPGEFRDSPINGLKLVDGNVECVSCHDPHAPENGIFLRVANTNSALCLSCHIK
ncbi:MAG: cytochrome c3 family protein [Sulfurimonas sp.]|nr:cytochrome c3 family protein [Sulfurimonas sp.]